MHFFQIRKGPGASPAKFIAGSSRARSAPCLDSAPHCCSSRPTARWGQFSRHWHGRRIFPPVGADQPFHPASASRPVPRRVSLRLAGPLRWVAGAAATSGTGAGVGAGVASTGASASGGSSSSAKEAAGSASTGVVSAAGSGWVPWPLPRFFLRGRRRFLAGFSSGSGPSRSARVESMTPTCASNSVQYTSANSGATSLQWSITWT